MMADQDAFGRIASNQTLCQQCVEDLEVSDTKMGECKIKLASATLSKANGYQPLSLRPLSLSLFLGIRDYLHHQLRMVQILSDVVSDGLAETAAERFA